jgi:formylglycine-generating enzyme required for sulfatase activity
MELMTITGIETCRLDQAGHAACEGGMKHRFAGAALLMLACAAQAQPLPLPLPDGAAFSDCADCPEMVMIPAGRFVMGTAPGEEEREALPMEFRHRSEPRREVAVGRFAAGRFEVTRAQYRVFTEATGRSSGGDGGCFVWAGSAFQWDAGRSWRDPGYAQDERHPAVCVSWEDALAYARWLSQRTGRHYRLLSEAEWEYAARAGAATARFWGDDAQLACAHANGADRTAAAQVPGAESWQLLPCNDGHARTAPAGSFAANAFGLHDMLGNVWEWTQDCWNASHAGAPTDGRARDSGDCSMRAVKGGSWEDGPAGLRAAYRVGSPAVIRVFIRGFRVARSE